MMRSWARRDGSNPLGLLSLHPRCGKIRADVNRQIIQISPYGRGRSAFEIPVWFRLGRLRVDHSTDIGPRRGVSVANVVSVRGTPRLASAAWWPPGGVCTSISPSRVTLASAGVACVRSTQAQVFGQRSFSTSMRAHLRLLK